ncbi:EscJ/YscJ/HrcJ family type III secretion inner membrane ring protein [Starkeya sp. ORNL1]|uniref:type III secretion system inner membrane ring lipoprotein SctJ n=1 Tax=Starkeya sp. ORNL1 TaxID=2709380 RepID=UPI001464166F|nr:type III secretion inner membrane ring lipoprotein SctJ [Starkeya sp. ORNL1]QJP15561.1 EscJ/YscJ/HrcJ family type III secretion inner membrane ring protein [Starkeya sp. ORNL1]
MRPREAAKWRRPAVKAAFLAMALALGACKADLYTNLTEVDANQMMAILLANGISASKAPVGEGFTVQVQDGDMLRAISLLNERGFPKSTRDSIGKVFEKSGIMSSPFEERVRYIYALGEEVARTLSQIDGVVTARVHIVLPEAPKLGQTIKPSSAAIFIKHQPGVDLDFLVPQIRRLVSSSIEGLDYAAVTVVLVEAEPIRTPLAAAAAVSTVEVLPGVSILQSDQERFMQFAYVGAGVFALLLIGSIAGLIGMVRSRPRKRGDAGPGGSAVMEPS